MSHGFIYQRRCGKDRRDRCAAHTDGLGEQKRRAWVCVYIDTTEVIGVTGEEMMEAMIMGSLLFFFFKLESSLSD